jgi:hypothetical protein
MRIIVALLLITLLITLGCGRTAMEEAESTDSKRSPAQVGQNPGGGKMETRQGLSAERAPLAPADSHSGSSQLSFQQVALADAATAQAVSQAADRKIIRNAELSIETDSPKDAQARIATIAESNSGFVVTSEFKQSGASSTALETVTITVRVPSLQFGQALASIRSAGTKVIQEKISGQDVTEEFIDLESRIRTQRALEGQFLEIMKQARKVSDALEVQSQLADVRTEIERLEGRRRFLDNRSSLSTITVTLQTAAPLVVATTSGFSKDVKDAFGDGVDTAVAIVLGFIRIVIVLAPVALLIVLPGWFVLRRLIRRYPWPSKQEPAGITPAD